MVWKSGLFFLIIWSKVQFGGNKILDFSGKILGLSERSLMIELRDHLIVKTE